MGEIFSDVGEVSFLAFDEVFGSQNEERFYIIMEMFEKVIER